jgi:hypothetical protein
MGRRRKPERVLPRDYAACGRWALASIKRIIQRERVSCDPFEEPENADSQKEKERRVDNGKCSSRLGWIQESWEDLWEEGEDFSGKEKREGPVQKKSFGLGVGPTFGAVLVRRTSAAVCHTDPCSLPFFLGLGLWPPTPFLLLPDPSVQLKQSCPDRFGGEWAI